MSRPYIHINIAMTTDGKIYTFKRRGATISSKRDKKRVNKMRAETDAAMVGGHTLLAVNPKLRVKSAELRAKYLHPTLSFFAAI